MIEPRLTVRERDVSDAPQMEVEHAVFYAGLDQRGRFVGELLPVAHKREQHAYSHVARNAEAST